LFIAQILVQINSIDKYLNLKDKSNNNTSLKDMTDLTLSKP